MSKSTPVPTANTFAEAFPNSTKVFENGVPFREVKLGGGEAPIRLYDTSGPQGHDPKQGLPKLRESWLVQRRANSKAEGSWMAPGTPSFRLHPPRCPDKSAGRHSELP